MIFPQAAIALLALLVFAPPLPAAEAPGAAKLEKAADLYRSAIAKDDSYAEAHLGLAYTLLLRYVADPETGTAGLEESLAHIEKAQKLQPLSPDGWRRKSTILYHLGRRDEGLHALDEGIAALPDAYELYGAKISYLVNTGRKDAAVEFFARKDFSVRDGAEMFYSIGEAWYDLGENFLARVAFTRAIDHRESAEAHEMIGRTFVAEENWEKAAEAFGWAIEVEPEYNELYEDIALCLAQQGKSQEAIEWLDAYTFNFPDDLAALKDLALLHEKAGQKVKARLLWTKIRSRAESAEDREFASGRIEELKGKR